MTRMVGTKSSPSYMYSEAMLCLVHSFRFFGKVATAYPTTCHRSGRRMFSAMP